MKGAKFLAAEGARVRVKCCGLTRVKDAVAAARLGVDAIGLVFYPRSPRWVNPQRALEIASTLPPEIARVGLFVNASVAEVEAVLDEVPLDLLQFHGDEKPDYCRAFAHPYLKALRVGAGGILPHTFPAHTFPAHTFPGAFGLLLDSFEEGRYGGTGKPFKWSLARDFSQRSPGARIVLAGGLHAGNVAQAIRATLPYAVDVSSGVEVAPGHKDPAKIAAFLHEVKNAHA